MAGLLLPLAPLLLLSPGALIKGTLLIALGGGNTLGLGEAMLMLVPAEPDAVGSPAAVPVVVVMAALLLLCGGTAAAEFGFAISFSLASSLVMNPSMERD